MHELLELKITFKNLDEILYHEISSDEIKNPDYLKLLNIICLIRFIWKDKMKRF